jgi:hypothetical protein
MPNLKPKNLRAIVIRAVSALSLLPAIILWQASSAPAQNEQGPTTATYSASGHIVDAGTLQAVAGVRFVYGEVSNTARDGGFIHFSIRPSDSRGEFHLDHLKPGKYAVYVAASLTHTDLYSDPVFFTIGESDVTDLEVRVRQGSTLSGTVLPEGLLTQETLSKLKLIAAVPSIGTLRAGITMQSTVAENGSFQISGLRPGILRLNLNTADVPELKGLSIARVERDGVEQKQDIEIKQGESIVGVRVFVRQGAGVIRGHVNVEGGALPVGARLLVSLGRDGSATGYIEVDPNGQFKVEGLAAGTYDIVLNVYPPLPQPRVPIMPPVGQKVTVADYVDSDVAFTIDVRHKLK